MASFNFKVDSALLRELGERLVGKPHIALAELVKNAFDADATDVVIRLRGDEIEVEDNGHGMTEEEFDGFWMRIGSTHKAREARSRGFGRPLTGSKGVGRLAGQFLARRMTISSTSDRSPSKVMVGRVDWRQAVADKDITSISVPYRVWPRTRSYVGRSKHGTRIRLRRLNQEWSPEAIADLAREIWWLTPPFRTNRRLATDRQRTFNIRFEAEDPASEQTFRRLIGAVLNLWYAKLVGRLVQVREDGTGEAELIVEWQDGDTRRIGYEIENCRLHEADFEVLVYHLQRRQAQGIKVGEARDYLNSNGNVHIFDAGFHLPYYGPDVDWLRVEFDHAHRLSESKLLPKDLQVSRGMNYLPTQSRLLGVVNVNTGEEQRATASHRKARASGKAIPEPLTLQITRDRLVPNAAFESLRKLVRWSLDYYAMEEARRVYREKEKNRETPRVKLTRLEDVLDRFEGRIERNALEELRENVGEVIEATEEEARRFDQRTGLLGALASAGMSALAFQHEHQRQLQSLDLIGRELRALGAKNAKVRPALEAIAVRLDEWLGQTRAVFSLFQNLASAENRETRARLRARPAIEEVARQIGPLLRGIEVDCDGVEEGFRLPLGTQAEWSAIFQNVLLNAANALLDSEEQSIRVSSRATHGTRMIIVEDTGAGVDLEHANELFEPFTRRQRISRERQALGYGGTGLGLTIVRMIASALSCEADFTRPAAGFRTAFRIYWKERA